MKLILVEGQKDVEICIKNHEFNGFQIISFDFLAHKALRRKNLPHKIIEEYFEEAEHEELDLKAINLTTNWYKAEFCENLLKFQGINFGELFIQKGIEYFFPVLKRVMGIIKILEKENPNEIICYSLKKYVSALSKNKEIIKTLNFEESIKIMGETHYEIPLKIVGKTKFLKINRDKYHKIKNIFEGITDLFFKVNFDLNSKQENILLLEFNPVIYYDLLYSLSKTSKNIILLNQRRPAIWNRKSLKIVRELNCKVLQLEKFLTNDLSLDIKNEIQIMKNNIDKVWSNPQFGNIFTIGDYTYWDAIKEDFKNIFIHRNEEIIRKCILLKKFFETVKIKSILEWSHVGMEESIVLSQSQKHNISTISLQHGIFSENKKFEKYQPILPVLPSKNIKIGVWGKIIQDYIINHGIDEKNVLMIGSPRHDIYFKTKKIQNKKNKTVLIVENGFFHPSFDGSDSRSFDYLEECIRKTFQILKQYEDINILVKLHPSPTYYSISELIKEISPTTIIYKSEDILDIIKQSDIVIALNYSTALLDAMILEKPTILILTEKQNYEEESMIQKNATLVIQKIDMIKTSIEKILYNEKGSTELIKASNEYLKEYFVNPGNSSNIIKDILDK